MSAKNGVIVVFAEFSAPICVAIPNYSGISPTIIFNQAWNQTVLQVMLELNEYPITGVNSELIKGLLKTRLLSNLNARQAG